MHNFLDTSAILNNVADLFDNVYISPLVLSELETIKSNNTSGHLKYLARDTVRDIIYTTKYTTPIVSQRKVNKIIKHNNFLQNINDHRIIAEAICCANIYEPVRFITCDANQYLIARELEYKYKNFTAEYLDYDKEEPKQKYCGWSEHYPNEEQMTMLYSNPEVNSLKLKVNEFAKIFEHNELKDILFWNGEKYIPLKYKPFKNKYLNEIITPRNTEQKMAFHLLQNPDIKVKLLMSAWGSGKTMLALNYALDQISKGYYSKLVFVRNNIIVADTNDIGFMPGNVRDKMSIWSQVLADHLGGQEILEQLLDDGIIETFPLSHMRGRSIHSAIVICDECENMNDKLVTLLLSRIEEDSEIIFCGDIAQIDNKKFEKNNGVRAMIEHLAGDPLFGMVKLIKSERGPVPRLCDKIRPPI